MCGRLTFYHNKNELSSSIFNLDLPFDLPKEYNLAPSSLILTIHLYQGELRLIPKRWGLIPHWSKDPLSHKNTFNARIESVTEKPTFRTAFKHHRCIIPVSGYFEWATKGKEKIPYYIKDRTNRPLLLAGIWDEYDREDEIIQSCSILTTVSSNPLSEIHPRMPILLNKNQIIDWIDPTIQIPFKKFPWLKSQQNPYLDFHRVSKNVNSVQYQEEDTVDKIQVDPSHQQIEFNF